MHQVGFCLGHASLMGILGAATNRNDFTKEYFFVGVMTSIFFQVLSEVLESTILDNYENTQPLEARRRVRTITNLISPIFPLMAADYYYITGFEYQFSYMWILFVAGSYVFSKALSTEILDGKDFSLLNKNRRLAWPLN